MLPMVKVILFGLAILFLILIIAYSTVIKPAPTEESLIPDPLQDFTVENQPKVWERLFIWRPINERVIIWWQNKVKPVIQEWLNNKKRDIEEGLDEEQKEWSEKMNGFLIKTWEKIWDKFKKGKEKEIDTPAEELDKQLSEQ